LDNIVLMAMRKDPERRYGSVNRFADDIARYLGGRPVLARQDSLVYRTRKFVRRNRLTMAAGFLILLTGWLIVDPMVSLVINGVIVWGTWGLLRDSVQMSMAAVPADIDPAAVRNFLVSRPGVAAVHDLHIWPMSTTENALTCHLVMPEGHPGDAFLHELARDLMKRFKIVHATVQIEVDPRLACALAPDEVV